MVWVQGLFFLNTFLIELHGSLGYKLLRSVIISKQKHNDRNGIVRVLIIERMEISFVYKATDGRTR